MINPVIYIDQWFKYTWRLFEWWTNFWTSCTMLWVFMKKTSLSDFLFSVAAWLSSILAIWDGNLTTFINNGCCFIASDRHELKEPQAAPAGWETGKGQRWCCWHTEPFLSWWPSLRLEGYGLKHSSWCPEAPAGAKRGLSESSSDAPPILSAKTHTYKS